MREYERSYKDYRVSEFDNVPVQFLVVPTFIWRGSKRGDVDEFVVSLAVSNSSLSALGYNSVTTGGSWTEIAHSDHNPTDGHDIYDRSDPKQLHVDVNQPYADREYAVVYRKLKNGSPPTPVGTAANVAKKLLVLHRTRFLSDFLP